MKMFIALLLIAVLTLLCWDRVMRPVDQRSLAERNEASLNNPRTLGRLPDGRLLERVFIRDERCEGCSTTSVPVYFVRGAASTTVQVPKGKVRVNIPVIELE